MARRDTYKKGFTLIELLVVVAIIGVLSSVVFSSMSAARGKAKDSAVKEDVTQLESMMILQYDDYGSFCDLEPGWIALDGTCSAAFGAGIHAEKAGEICSHLVQNSSATDPDLKLYIFVDPILSDCDDNYSIMVPLSNGKYYCAGSSGVKAEYDDYDGQPGCYNNP